MTRRWPALLLAAAACSALANNDDGVASLEIRLPANFYLELGLPIQLQADARNADGQVIDVPIQWLTADTTVTLDQTGLVTPKQASGTAHILVGVFGKDTLLSNPDSLVLFLTERADSLRLAGPDSLDVAAGTQASPPLEVALVAAGTGVSGRPIGFAIVDPVQGDKPDVVLRTLKVRDSLLSGSTGAPSSPMTIRVATGRTPPDRVVVEATAYRATGEAIPGSGIRFVVRFRH